MGLFADSLTIAVPLHIKEIEQSGGPSELDIKNLPNIAHLIAENGDILMYGGKKGEAAKLFNELSHAIAILSFSPGGITTFGLHFEGKRK